MIISAGGEPKQIVQHKERDTVSDLSSIFTAKKKSDFRMEDFSEKKKPRQKEDERNKKQELLQGVPTCM